MNAFGFVRFEPLRAEAVGRYSFEFFQLLLLLTIGTRGLFASRQTPFLFHLVGRAVTVTQGTYVAVSGGIVGWIIGLTLFSLLKAEAANVALGLFLLIWMLLFSGAPLMWKSEIEQQARQYFELRFKVRRFSYFFRLCCIGIIGISIWGTVCRATLN